MSFNGYSQQQLDALSVGRTPSFFPVVFKYAPTANFINFPIGQFWVDTATQILYYLEGFSNSSGITQATWIPISASSVLITLSDTANTTVMPSNGAAIPPNNIQLVGAGGITIVSNPGSNLITITGSGAGSQTLTGNDTVAVSPSGGTIQTLGNTVSNSTYGQALWTTNPSGNIEQFNIQVAAAIGSGNVAKAGIAAFNNAQFTVNTTTGFVSLSGGSGAAIQTITPNSGGPISPSSGNINLVTANTTVKFVGSGSTITEDFGLNNLVIGSSAPSLALGTNNVGLGQLTLASLTNGAGNTFIGYNSGNALTTGSNNTGVGSQNLLKITASVQNVALGATALVNLTTSVGSNTAIGYASLLSLMTGTSNIALGTNSGGNYSGAESSNILIGSGGVTAESNTIHIGTQGSGTGQQNTAYMAGITGVNVGSVATVVSIATGTGQLGTVTLVGTGGTTVTASANTITINSSGGGGGALNTLTANSGANPVSPTGGGTINVLGAGSITTVATANTVTAQLTGLTANNVLIGQGTSTIGLVAPGVAGTVLTSNGAAPPSFQTLGSLGATLSYTLDRAITPVVPDGSGVVTITGAQVGTGLVGNNVIGTAGNSPNSIVIQIQRSTQNVTSNGMLNGVSHFNSASFNVDMNGFVSLNGNAGVFTLSDDVNTQVPPLGGNIQLTGHVVNQSGNFSTTVSNAGSHLIAINPMSCARWIVDPLGFNGTHTTIQAAINAATSGDDIILMPATYTENPILKTGVNLIAWPADSWGNQNVEIVGRCLYTGNGNVVLSGITLITNGSYAVSVTGSNNSNVYLVGCVINNTNFTGLNNSSSGSSNIYCRYCDGTMSSNNPFFTNSSPSGMNFFFCNFSNSASSNKAASTSSSGGIGFISCQIGFPITTSGGSGVQISNCQMNGIASNTTILTHGGTGPGGIRYTNADSSGTAVTISIGGSATLYVVSSSLGSNNATAMIGGTGTLYYANVVALGTTSGLAAALTKVALSKQN